MVYLDICLKLDFWSSMQFCMHGVINKCISMFLCDTQVLLSQVSSTMAGGLEMYGSWAV